MFASLLTSALAFSGAARAPAPRSSVTTHHGGEQVGRRALLREARSQRDINQ
jgi:hypothetical protein